DDALTGRVVDGVDGLVRGRHRVGGSIQHDRAAGAIDGGGGVGDDADIVAGDIAIDGVGIAVARQVDKIIGAAEGDGVAAAGHGAGEAAARIDGVARADDALTGRVVDGVDGLVRGRHRVAGSIQHDRTAGAVDGGGGVGDDADIV